MNIHTKTFAYRFYIVPTKRDKRDQLYSVIFNGRVVILETHLPSVDGCRYLASMGLSGRAEMWDFERAYPRMIFPDLVSAGEMTVDDRGDRRPRVIPLSQPSGDSRERRQVPIHKGSEVWMDNHPSNHERLSEMA